MKKQLILFTILLLATSLAYAEQPKSTIKNIAPELIVKEEDFSYDNYKDSMKFIQSVVSEYESGKKYDPDLDFNYIGIPNNLLRLEGYGLIAQKEIARLKLENARLRGTKQDEIVVLEKILKDIEKQIDVFLKKNIWVD